MALEQELGHSNPIHHQGHRAVLNVVITGELLAKEAGNLLRAYDLTEAHFNVLMLLVHQSPDGSLSQTELGRMMLVNRSNVTGLVDRMEQAGLVRRVASDHDRRVKQVKITSLGRRKLSKAEEPYFKRIEQLVQDLSKAQVQAMCDALEVVRGRLRNE